MKERPILFSAPQVRALLNGSKTQARRIVKPQPTNYIHNPPEPATFVLEDTGRWCVEDFEHECCPYGQPGERLWVRERWRVGAWFEGECQLCVDYHADGYCRREPIEVEDVDLFTRLWQQSTDDARNAMGEKERYKWKHGESPCRWRPSIHMPRWASRITLEIAGIRVERLQDISEHDAMCEGVSFDGRAIAPYYIDGTKHRGTYAAGCFRYLWNEINGDGPHNWNYNPFIWVVSFKRVMP